MKENALFRWEFMEEGLYPRALFCNFLQSKIDILTAEGKLPFCQESAIKEGACDNRYCIWSLGVALGLTITADITGTNLWHLRELAFFGPIWKIDWCESAWNPSTQLWPIGQIPGNFSRSDVQNLTTEILMEPIEKAVTITAKEDKLSFFDMGSLEYAPDGREPYETPEIVSWAHKCADAIPDILFWMGPGTMSWFLPCIRPQNVHQEEGKDLVLKLGASDVEEIIKKGRGVAVQRLRELSVRDEIISRICLSSSHKLAWCLCKGRPPIIYMGKE